MNFSNLKSFAPVLFCAVAFCLSTAAQTAAPIAPTVSADETFELNIVNRRITEMNFRRSTAVESAGENGGSGNVRLEVGVAATVERIDVILRGITGRVTFRGSLDIVRRKIEQNRRAADPPLATQP